MTQCAHRQSWLLQLLLGLLVGSTVEGQAILTLAASTEPVSVVESTGTRLVDGRSLVMSGTAEQPPARVVDGSGATLVAFRADQVLARQEHTATLLPTGQVLVVGGRDQDGQLIQTVEVFDSSREVFKTVGRSPAIARAGHRTLVLRDGRVLLTGGTDEGHRPVTMTELWDWRTGASELVPADLTWQTSIATAQFLSDGRLFFVEPANEQNPSRPRADLIPSDRVSRLAAWPAIQSVERASAGEAAVRPTSDRPSRAQADVPVDGVMAVDLGEPIDRTAVSTDAVTLMGPLGPVTIVVAVTDDGRCLVIKPQEDLLPLTTYTLVVTGLRDQQARPLPPSVTTVTTPRVSPMPGPTTVRDETDEEAWTPTRSHRGGAWTSGKRPDPPPLRATASVPSATPAGATALTGHVLRLNGTPLEEVTVKIGSIVGQTDAQGLFLLRGLTPGPHELIVDGRTATHGGARYGLSTMRVTLHEGQVTELADAIWMPKIREQDLFRIASPTSQEVVITHPDLPGLEIHIPEHTVIRDADGKIVTELAITPVPLDRAPFPVPVNFPMYFMISPGGATVHNLSAPTSPGIRIIYPNYAGHPVGTRVDLWVHDPRHRGWFVYGHGQVTADAQHVVPDPGVGLHEHLGAGHGLPSATTPAQIPATATSCLAGTKGNGSNGQGPATAGHPVDLRTGLFIEHWTDIVLNDVMPIRFTRTYRPGDASERPFGKGMTHAYQMYLYTATGLVESTITLILPDGGQIPFQRIPGIGPNNNMHEWVWEHKSTPTGFYGARLTANSANPGGLPKRFEVTLKDGMVYEFNYGPGTFLTGIRDRFGNRVTITRSGSLISTITTQNGRSLVVTNNASNRISQITDPQTSRVWTYTYDAAGLLAKVTYPDLTFEEYTYDASGRMTTLKDRRGTITVTNQYDPVSGRVTQQTLATGTPDQAIYQFAYTTDANGVVTQADVTDPRNNVRRVTFHASGYCATNTNALGTPKAQATTFVRDATSGLLQSKTDALSRQTTYTYDSLGNVKTVTRLAGTPQAVTDTFTYTADWNQVKTYTDPLNHITTFGYNERGALISIKNHLNHETVLTYNGAGQPLTITDPLSHTTTFTYEQGVLRSVRDHLNRTTTYWSDVVGRITQITDPLGNRTVVEYDVMDRVKKLTDAIKGMTQFTYDNNGNLTEVKDAKNQPTVFGYDKRNRPTSRKDALLNTETATYDGMSNLATVTDRKGQITTYQYDVLDRPSVTTYHGGTTSSTYTFDAGDRLTQVVDTVSGTITRGYNGLDLLTSETTPQGSVTYTYDNASRRATMTVAGQTQIVYGFDNADRLLTLTQGTSQVTIGYDNASRRTTVTYPNGNNLVYGYNDANDLTSLTYKQGATVLGDLTYSYDLAGRRTNIGGTFARSNLPPALTTTTYNANNQQTVFGTNTLTYDLHGNLNTVTDASGTSTYTWNVRNQLTGLSATGFSASFTYDAFGRRTGKTIQGTTTNFVYDGLNPVQEKNGATVTANLLTGLGIDEFFTRTDGAGVRSLLPDALGSTVALGDATGTPQTQYTYEPFGFTSQTGVASTNSYKYTGREDDGSGLMYYRARYYHPRLQRFISEDPLGVFSGDTNLYAYVRNSPLSFLDPFGLQSLEACSFSGGCSPMKDPSPDTDLEHLRQSVRDELVQDPLGVALNHLRDQLKEPVKNRAADIAIDKGMETIDRNCGKLLGRCGVPTIPPMILEEIRKILSPSAADAAELVLKKDPSCQR